MADNPTALHRSELKGCALLHTGKVRDSYDLGEEMLLIASDRISAFDVVFPTAIPSKGRVLTRMAEHWFKTLKSAAPHHMVEVPTAEWLAQFSDEPEVYEGRCTRVKKAKPFPIECIVRGSMEGSGWKEYQKRSAIQEHPLPAGLQLHDELPEPLYTPSTKAETGHDENITFAQTVEIVGQEVAEKLRDRSLALFREAHAVLKTQGITLADTKFEFGELDGEIILIDEVLTPDSSRFLVKDAEGKTISMDKQFVRDWAETLDWDKTDPAPAIPEDIVTQTSLRYREIADQIIGQEIE